MKQPSSPRKPVGRPALAGAQRVGRLFGLTDYEFEHLQGLDPTGNRVAVVGLRALIAQSRASTAKKEKTS